MTSIDARKWTRVTLIRSNIWINAAISRRRHAAGTQPFDARAGRYSGQGAAHLRMRGLRVRNRQWP